MTGDVPKIWIPGDPIPDDMKEFHFVSWIDDSIAVTSYAVARDVDVLSHEGIDSIVSLGELTPPDVGGRHVERIRKFYDKEEAADIRDEAIARAVSAVLRLSSEGKVLVHCAAGVSRSPGVCMLSLCVRDGLGWDEAKRIVAEKRRIANVHPMLEARLTRWLAVNR